VRGTLAGEAKQPSQPGDNRLPATRIAWAVKAASRYVPAANCLPRALATQTMLRQRGYPARIYIGLAKAEAGQLEAHAWVESEGKILMGGLQDLARYAPPARRSGPTVYAKRVVSDRPLPDRLTAT